MNALKPICNQKLVTCLDLNKSPDWNYNLYRDGIHPSIEGNAVIADIMRNSIIMK